MTLNTGGGDAKAAALELHTIIDDTLISDQHFAHASNVPNKRSKLSQILWPLGKSVGLRDIKVPGTTAIADSMQYFPVSSATRVSSIDHSRHSPYRPQSTTIAKWLQNGFNATVVNYGPNYDLKTKAVFGPQVPLVALQNPETTAMLTSPTMISEVLGQLYNTRIDAGHIPSVPLPAPCTIAISMWYLQNNHVVDVCASTSKTSTGKGATAHSHTNSEEKLAKEWLQFESIQCPDYETAMRVIQTGRSRCPQSEEHHVFLRVLLYRPNRAASTSSISDSPYAQNGSISHLHLVDLAHSSGVDTADHRHLPTESNRIARR